MMTGSPDGADGAATDDTDAVLEEWSRLLRAELGLSDVEVDIRSVLSLAGLAAHGVVRPAAPLTTFLVGYAAGAAASVATGWGPADAVDAAGAADAAERATAAARRLIRARSEGA
jgi:hypothetical protein